MWWAFYILVEFDRNKDMLIIYKFQVDKVHKSKDFKYDLIIGSDILYNLQINLLFLEERIRWGSPNNPFHYNLILMKELGLMSEQNFCDVLYDLHKTSLMLQTEEERLGKILDADYSKVDINNMEIDLDIAKTRWRS